MAVSTLPQDAAPLSEPGWRRARAEPLAVGGVRHDRDAPAPGRSGGSSSPFSGPAIWSPSATWTRATGRPRSPAAPSSATRCSPSRCSPTSWRSCCRRCARGSASAPAAIWRRPAATPSRARSSWPLWVLAEIAICATDLAEVIGTAIGLNLLFGIPLEIGVLHHRARRVPDPVAAEPRLPLDRGASS